MIDTYSADAVAKAIENGFEVLPPYEPVYPAYGLVRSSPTEIETVTVIPPQEDFCWAWPPEGAPAVYGPLSDEDRLRVERGAIQEIKAIGVGAKMILWRQKPKWAWEKDFERDATKVWFIARGVFVWKPDKPT